MLVVFEDRVEPSIVRLLRPGFRHCFCLVGGDLAWTVCDPLASRIELFPLLGFNESELAQHYACGGRTVLVGSVAVARVCRKAAMRAVSCVEIVKRVLNFQAGRVFTPFQLYRALLAEGEPPRRFHQYGENS